MNRIGVLNRIEKKRIDRVRNNRVELNVKQDNSKLKRVNQSGVEFGIEQC